MAKNKKPVVCARPVINVVAGCERCQWAADDKSDEQFEYCFGLAVYNIEKAKQIVKDGREAMDCDISQLAIFVDYPKKDGVVCDPFKTHVHEAHVDHVNADQPVILGFTIKPRGDDPDQRRFLMPIDGAHRIARAIKDGRTTMKVYALTEEESDAIITDRRPPMRKRRAAKRK